jgi:hypothetical protein
MRRFGQCDLFRFSSKDGDGALFFPRKRDRDSGFSAFTGTALRHYATGLRWDYGDRGYD